MPLHHIMRPSFSTVDPTLPDTWDHPTRPSTTIATVTDDHHSFAFRKRQTCWAPLHNVATSTSPHLHVSLRASPPTCSATCLCGPTTSPLSNLSVTQLFPPSPTPSHAPSRSLSGTESHALETESVSSKTVSILIGGGWLCFLIQQPTKVSL
ncbi:hypothetical protein PIB30_066935 [Stylosanthes scabra]|uniref:Uncharacterized protein n=1 Tax=Stylosanthes scabra TaxID=79078 RepID=A0ABU6XMJ1_9FABA|nr:hypothetical protein [Stylosanthes scabra]